jgi:hypothetical protein
MPVNFGGPGVQPSLGPLTSNTIKLASGETWLIPSGRWCIKSGPYTSTQQFDQVTGIWRTIGAGDTTAVLEAIFSDGVNYRLANQTGCAVGAAVTTAGTGYTSAPVVTASAGASIWRAVVGGAISTTITITNGGSNYTYPPILVLSSPPNGGVQATATCTISGGIINAVTVTDQGAGYSAPPTVQVLNDPREGINGIGTGYGGALITSLTGSGTITAVLCVDHGIGGQTAIPTLTFTGGGGASAAATVIMCWSITGLVVSSTTAGSGYAAPVIISGYDTPPSQTSNTNPTISSLLVRERAATIVGAVSAVALTTTGVVIKDGGIYTAAPTLFAFGFIQGAAAVQAVISAQMGGQTDVSTVFQT